MLGARLPLKIKYDAPTNPCMDAAKKMNVLYAMLESDEYTICIRRLLNRRRPVPGATSSYDMATVKTIC